jgi:hypothetical protein
MERSADQPEAVKALLVARDLQHAAALQEVLVARDLQHAAALQEALAQRDRVHTAALEAAKHEVGEQYASSVAAGGGMADASHVSAVEAAVEAHYWHRKQAEQHAVALQKMERMHAHALTHAVNAGPSARCNNKHALPTLLAHAFALDFRFSPSPSGASSLSRSLYLSLSFLSRHT